ncbi:MAG: MFS transporter [Solirubrobacteraceae bacterium]|nr:MFS transporter [Solirubrobacteraceae bacterium]
MPKPAVPIDPTDLVAEEVSSRGRRDAVLLAGVLLACVTVPTAVSGSGVALPAIAADTGGGATSLQWVVNAFNLAFAASTLLAGSLADLFGRQRGFAAGVGLFLAASLLSALAPSILVLDAARALAGIGAAAIFACGSALLAVRFEGPRQARAFALLGTAAGIGLGIGPTVAGGLVDLLSWQAVFGAGAVSAAIVLGLLWVGRDEEPALRTDASVDVPGSLTFVGGLLLLMVAIVQASEWGWGSASTLGVAAVAVVALLAFAAIERRGAHPLLDLGLLGDRQLVGLILVPVVAAIGFVTLLTYLPTYMSTVWGDGTGEAGLKMLLMTVPVVVAPLLAGAAVGRGATPRQVIVASLALLVAGPALLLPIGPETSVWLIAPGMIAIGAGFGLGVGLVDGQAIGRAPADRSGMAAGLVNTSRLGSEAVAVAAYASLLTSLAAARASDGPVRAYDGALHVVLIGLVGSTFALSALTAWLLRPAASQSATARSSTTTPATATTTQGSPS